MSKSLHVSFSTALDIETRELGEDFPAVKQVNEAFARLETLLDKLRGSASSSQTKARAHEFYTMLSDARDEARWRSHSAEADEAYRIADVRPVLTLVT